ncbi:hypothetical protein N7508_007684 [Penicillium antarcticum]|uniref:uncharacterized protein n=1 Tax=Penicillium antarcticum TaxID=416450 RepID=UPI0023934D18|nr:uncharacterized protein N7508_007684 [Penicillium antarcticum]KAJ5297435.1 hypothetical protein N7508_007684 [Penicillium antarcticum]
MTLKAEQGIQGKAKNKRSLEYVLKSGLAGGLAGCAAKTIVAPLDRVKILFQTSTPAYERYIGSWKGFVSALSSINSHEGFRGLFKGHSATLLQKFPYAAINFLMYEQMRALFISSPEKETPLRRFLSGSFSGATSVFFTYPLDLVRVRLAIESRSHRSSLKSICRQIYHEQNGALQSHGIAVRGINTTLSNAIEKVLPLSKLCNFYRGFSPTMLGMLPYAGMSFFTHDTVSDWLRRPELAKHTTVAQITEDGVSQRPPLKIGAQLTAGALAGTIAQTTSYPLEVIRRRIQASGAMQGEGDCVYPKQALVLNSPGASFLRSLKISRVDVTVPLPVESRPHMPMLIHSFIETFGMEPLPVDGSSLAWLLRASWIQQALSDPCALHTTLYAASAHLDAFRGVKNKNMTLYHHTIALQLLQERINDSEAMFSESLMACIAPLVFFSALLGDKGLSKMHKMALMQMIKVQGGLEHLALGAFLSGLITVCVLTEAIIMDSALEIPFLNIPPTPLMPPTYFTSAVLRRAANREGGYYNLSHEVIEIFEHIDFITHVLPDGPGAVDIRAKWTAKMEDFSLSIDYQQTQENTDDGSIKSDADAITKACQTAALIFWYFFLDDEYVASFSMTVLQHLVRKLKYALSRGSMDTWVRTAPEAHTWICLLGTAAALDMNDRVWFSLRHGQPVICIESRGASVFLQNWSMYSWANRRRNERMRATAEEDILPEETQKSDGGQDEEGEEEDGEEDSEEDEGNEEKRKKI